MNGTKIIKEDRSKIKKQSDKASDPPTVLFLILASFLALTLFVLLGSGTAKAHTLWLETPESSPPANQPLKVDIGFNDGFELIDIIEGSVPKISTPVIVGKDGEIKTKAAGGPNYAFVSETPIKDGGYLAFTEYEPFVMGHGDTPKNRYYMTGKAVVNVGKTDDSLIVKPLGKSALEIVPLANPNTLKAGGSLPVQVYFDGKPLPRATVLGEFRGFNPKGSWGLAKAFYCVTDKDGKVDFLPVKGGLWMLKVRHVAGNDAEEGVSEIVHITDITFRVSD
jgi:uncharacterized GH25 family protein